MKSMPNNKKTWWIIGAVVTVILSMVAVAYGYGRYTERVDSLLSTVLKADANERAIIGMEKDIQYIKLGIDDIKKELRIGKNARRGTKTTK